MSDDLQFVDTNILTEGRFARPFGLCFFTPAASPVSPRQSPPLARISYSNPPESSDNLPFRLQFRTVTKRLRLGVEFGGRFLV